MPFNSESCESTLSLRIVAPLANRREADIVAHTSDLLLQGCGVSFSIVQEHSPAINGVALANGDGAAGDAGVRAKEPNGVVEGKLLDFGDDSLPNDAAAGGAPTNKMSNGAMIGHCSNMDEGGVTATYVPSSTIVASRAVQHEFETEMLEMNATVVVSSDSNYIYPTIQTEEHKRQEAALVLQRLWCQACRWLVPSDRLDTMPRLYFKDHDSFFRKCIMVHEAISCASFSFGNLANNGNYLDRFTFHGAREHELIPGGMGISPAFSARASGRDTKGRYPIRATFEHDRKSLLVFFKTQPQTTAELASYIYAGHKSAYRFTIPYRHIHQLVVDYGGDTDDPESGGSATEMSLYFWLKVPPRVFKVDPPKENRGRGGYGNQSPGLDRTSEDPLLMKVFHTTRVLTFPGCSPEILANCLWLRIVIPKKQILMLPRDDEQPPFDMREIGKELNAIPDTGSLLPEMLPVEDESDRGLVVPPSACFSAPQPEIASTNGGYQNRSSGSRAQFAYDQYSHNNGNLFYGRGGRRGNFGNNYGGGGVGNNGNNYRGGNRCNNGFEHDQNFSNGCNNNDNSFNGQDYRQRGQFNQGSSRYGFNGLPSNNLEDSEGNNNGSSRDMPQLAFGSFFEIFSRISTRAKVSVAFSTIKSTPAPMQLYKPPRDLFGDRFGCMYALLGLLSRGLVVHDQLVSPSGRLFLDRAVELSIDHPEETEDALNRLTSALDEFRCFHLHRAFEYLYQTALAEGVQSDTPTNCLRVRKVIVTPLRMLFVEPEVMMSNRVLRNFGPEWALRLSFRDDDLTTLFHSSFVEDQFYWRIIERGMGNGIEIGLRTYNFLAWSNSQLRDNGCYLWADIPAKEFWAWRNDQDQDIFARPGEDMAQSLTNHDDGVITADNIRECLGSFDHIKNVPKLMARIGQCFTQTQRVLRIPKERVRTDPDVVGGAIDPGSDIEERYTFSDGVGRMSRQLAVDIAQVIELDYIPSAYQIRYAGFKGMLSVDPRLDDDPDGPIVIFRESMRKFYDPNTELEIVKHSQPSPVTLNRPLINILDQVTAKQDKLFHDTMTKNIHILLEKQLFTMADMLLDDRSSSTALTERTSIQMDFTSMLHNQFHFTKEPFFRGLLLAIHRKAVQHLFKARIEISPSVGRTMYGIMDEFGVLQYGQVFVQYSTNIKKPADYTENSSPKAILTGPVMVTKNPCISPGDVRKFEAVDVEALHGLVDVVVFPQFGPRPHPDEMAGSDLDGDEYSVIWEQNIFLCRNEAPAIFPKNRPRDLNKRLEVSDMVEFFHNYVTQDSIGFISTAHLIAADRFGLFDPVCTELALKHSMAVDFPKTGMAPEPLDEQERPEKYPDFMGKPKLSYVSRRICGQSYRKIKIIEDILALGQSDAEVALDPDLEVPGWEQFRDESIAERNVYNQYLQGLLDTYGIDDEWQLMSGHFTRIRNRYSDNDTEDFSFFNTEKIIELRVGRIQTQFRNRFFAEYPDMDNPESMMNCNNPEILRKASAWYMVTYNYKTYKNQGRMLSFPWTVWHVLNVIKQRAVFGQVKMILSNPVLSAFDQALQIKWGVAAREARLQEGEPYKLAGKLDSTTMADLLEVVRRDDAAPVIGTYMKFYPDLEIIVSTLLEWGWEENVFGSKRTIKETRVLRPSQLALLFLNWAVYERKKLRRNEKGEDIYLMEPHEIANEIDRGRATVSIVGPAELLLYFVKYLGTERFRNQVQVVINPALTNRYVLKQSHILPLHQISFKTYHHIALTGNFRSLGLTKERSVNPWDLNENDPIQISWDAPFPLRGPPYGPDVLEVIERLKAWTGVIDVNFRQCGRRNVMVSCSGVTEARHKLKYVMMRPKWWSPENSNPLQEFDF